MTHGGSNFRCRTHLLSALLVLALGIRLLAAAEDDSTTVNPPKNCSFYCFLTPDKNEMLPLDVSAWRGLGCSHLVYGWAVINGDRSLSTPTTNDVMLDSAYPNYVRVTALQKGQPQVKVLLGVREARDSSYIESEHTRRLVAERLVSHARDNYFAGLFLHIAKDQINSFQLERFLEAIQEAIEKGRERYGSLLVVLPMGARKIQRYHERIPVYEPLIDAFYIWADDVPSTQDPTVAVELDALASTEQIPAEDTISENLELLVVSGVPSEKIIVGLSTWARSYRLRDAENVGHGAPVHGVGPAGNLTRRTDGRLAYQEICLEVNSFNVTEDIEAGTVSGLRWISNHHFGGIGLSSMQGDDPTGECGRGTYPIHRFVKSRYHCKKRHRKVFDTACQRICMFRPDKAPTTFEWSQLQAQWCSHVQISTPLLDYGLANPFSKTPQAVREYQEWDVDPKPQLILSIGEEQSGLEWKALVANGFHASFVGNVKKVVQRYSADGVNIAWTDGVDKALHATVVKLLRDFLPKTAQIFVTLSPDEYLDKRYDLEAINKTADFIVVEGYRFVEFSSKFTGHHSPLFGGKQVLNDPRKTIQGITEALLSAEIPASKLIVSLTAESTSMNIENGATHEIGDPTVIFNELRDRLRTNAKGGVTQTELCVIKNAKNTNIHFHEEIASPFLTTKDEFIAFDDTRSIQIKTVWLSMQNFAGIALHGIEVDNIAGECPSGEPFPILRTVASTQVCGGCWHKFDASKATSDSPKLLVTTTRPANDTPPQCNPEFRVVCSYRLPHDGEENPLQPEDIPLQQCTELVTEEALLNGEGKVAYRDTSMAEHMRKLANISAVHDGFLVSTSVRCVMPEEEFDALLEHPTTLADALASHMEEFGFSGIELHCDDYVTVANRERFGNLLNELRGRLGSNATAGECPKAISLRLPVWQNDLQLKYDISQLNTLHYVSLEPFHATVNHTGMISPLFDAEPFKNHQHTINGTINAWIQAGLKRRSIVLYLPTYGIQTGGQKELSDSNQAVEDAVHGGVDIIPQNEVCETTKVQGTQNRVAYETVAAYTNGRRGEQLTYETQQTVQYKLRYAMREELGGIGLMHVNDEDFSDTCRQGPFPLLDTVDRTACPIPV